MKLKYVSSIIFFISTISTVQALSINPSILKIGATAAISAGSLQLGKYYREQAEINRLLDARTPSVYNGRKLQSSEHWQHYFNYSIKRNCCNAIALGTTLATAYMLVKKIIS